MKKWVGALLLGLFLSSIFTMGVHAQDTMNCGDFATKDAVMDFWSQNGYSATNDPHNLDGDSDGYPCEVTAGEYQSYIQNQNAAGGNDTGATMPNTASNNLSMMLFGIVIAAVGVFVTFHRKRV